MSKNKDNEIFLSKGHSVKKVSKHCKKQMESIYMTKKDKYYKKSQDFYKKKLFHYEDCWALFYSVSCFTLPRLMYLRKNHCGSPRKFFIMDDNMKILNEEEGHEKWNETLDWMIEAFYRIVYVDEFSLSEEEMKLNRSYIDKGLKLFYENFQDLWD